LLCKGICQKGVEVKKRILYSFLLPFVCLTISGCIPLIIGGAAGALGAYAISKDTIQGETDKPYDSLWNAASRVSKIRGSIKQEDSAQGHIELEAEQSKVDIRLIRLTRAATRLRIKARNKLHLPNLSLAQDIFVKIMEEAK